MVVPVVRTQSGPKRPLASRCRDPFCRLFSLVPARTAARLSNQRLPFPAPLFLAAARVGPYVLLFFYTMS